MADTRYPYTMAADYVRGLVKKQVALTVATSIDVPILSRCQAAAIWHELASVWNLDEVECAMKLADAQEARPDKEEIA